FSHRPHELALDGVRVDPLNEVLIDLDVFRPQFRPEPQIGKPFSEIVDRELQAAGAIPRGDIAQAFVRSRADRLGYLYDDLPGGCLGGIAAVLGHVAAAAAASHDIGTHIEEELAAEALT